MKDLRDEPIYSNLTNDPDLRPLIAGFVERLKVYSQRMNQSLELQDYDKIATIAHELKGSSASFGFEDIANLAAMIEVDSIPAKEYTIRGELAQLRLLSRRAALGCQV